MGQNRYEFYILMNSPLNVFLYQVHVFDKNADETISWISEKEAEISTDELGQDLETIQSLLERQQGFQRDLAAIQQQVILIVFVLFLTKMLRWLPWRRKQQS